MPKSPRILFSPRFCSCFTSTINRLFLVSLFMQTISQLWRTYLSYASSCTQARSLKRKRWCLCVCESDLKGLSDWAANLVQLDASKNKHVCFPRNEVHLDYFYLSVSVTISKDLELLNLSVNLNFDRYIKFIAVTAAKNLTGLFKAKRVLHIGAAP